jgi:hypothetical protein
MLKNNSCSPYVYNSQIRLGIQVLLWDEISVYNFKGYVALSSSIYKVASRNSEDRLSTIKNALLRIMDNIK